MIVDFLDTGRTKEDLKVALEVIEEFKHCESRDEWLYTPFVSWAKLEQLEEFLRHLVHGDELEKDTLEELERRRNDRHDEV